MNSDNLKLFNEAMALYEKSRFRRQSVRSHKNSMSLNMTLGEREYVWIAG